MDVEDIEQAARDQGWRVERTRRGHPLFYSPDGTTCVVGSGTPGDQRAILNLLSRLKRAGLQWPWTARQRRNQRKDG